MPKVPELLGDSGEYFFEDGTYYVGQFKDGQINGLGIMVQQDQNFEYGEFENTTKIRDLLKEEKL